MMWRMVLDDLYYGVKSGFKYISQEIKKYCFLSDSENGQKNSAPTSSPYIIVRKIATMGLNPDLSIIQIILCITYLSIFLVFYR